MQALDGRGDATFLQALDGRGDATFLHAGGPSVLPRENNCGFSIVSWYFSTLLWLLQ